MGMLKKSAEVLLIVGGLVHLGLAVLGTDLVQLLLGSMPPLARIVYGLVGASAVLVLVNKLR